MPHSPLLSIFFGYNYELNHKPSAAAIIQVALRSCLYKANIKVLFISLQNNLTNRRLTLTFQIVEKRQQRAFSSHVFRLQASLYILRGSNPQRFFRLSCTTRCRANTNLRLLPCQWQTIVTRVSSKQSRFGINRNISLLTRLWNARIWRRVRPEFIWTGQLRSLAIHAAYSQ